MDNLRTGPGAQFSSVQFAQDSSDFDGQSSVQMSLDGMRKI